MKTKEWAPSGVIPLHWPSPYGCHSGCGFSHQGLWFEYQANERTAENFAAFETLFPDDSVPVTTTQPQRRLASKIGATADAEGTVSMMDLMLRTTSVLGPNSELQAVRFRAANGTHRRRINQRFDELDAIKNRSAAAGIVVEVSDGIGQNVTAWYGTIEGDLFVDGLVRLQMNVLLQTRQISGVEPPLIDGMPPKNTTDQRILKALAALCAILFFYIGVWQPLSDFADEQQRRAARQSLADWIAANRPTLVRSGSQNTDSTGLPVRGGAPTIAQITSSAAQFGITLTRLQPESDGSVSVAVEQQPFNALQWLAGIENDQLRH